MRRFSLFAFHGRAASVFSLKSPSFVKKKNRSYKKMRPNLKLVKKHSRARAGEAARRAEAVVPARRDRAEARDLDLGHQ